MKFFMIAPFMIVGSRPACCRIQPIMPVVVDLPLVPPTRDALRRGIEELGEQFRAPHQGHAEPPRSLHVRHRLFDGRRCHQNLLGTASRRCRPGHEAPIPCARRNSNFWAQPPLVEGPVGSFDGIALCAQDQRQRQHPAAADSAEEIGSPLIRSRGHAH